MTGHDRPIDREGGSGESFDRRTWRRWAELGVHGLAVPTEYGGSGRDLSALADALEGLGYDSRDNGMLFSLGAHILACELPIVRFGTPTQKRRYLPSLVDGHAVAAHAMTEPSSGSDAFALATAARRSGDAWVLDGTKTFVTNGPVADAFVVFASTARDRGALGITAFLVDRSAPGLTVGAPTAKMGLRSSPMSDVYLESCHVPDEAVLGRRNAGAAVFLEAMRLERGLILATCVGAMRRIVDDIVERQRSNRGDRLAAHRIVDMLQRVTTCRRMLRHLASLLDDDEHVDRECALLKLAISESFVRIAAESMALAGMASCAAPCSGSGDGSRDLRDAVASRVYSGTSEIQRDVVARELGLPVDCRPGAGGERHARPHRH